MTDWDLFVEKLFSLTNSRGKDLSSVFEVDLSLGSPHKSFKSIHVGGTNGKGSVTWKIAKALEKEGFKVGLYTSPHLVDVRERIQVNSELISQEDFFLLAEPLMKYQDRLSFFDILTLTAFLYFQKMAVDFAVIEVGVGGRFDATNIIHPLVSVITSISKDHTQLLGEDLESIAFEKGGIIKDGSFLIVGSSAAQFFPNASVAEGHLFYDIENQNIARKALQYLKISENSILWGLQTRPPCRFQVIPKALTGNVNIILDVAHNPGGFEKLLQALKIYFPQEECFHFILGFSKDKDWKTCLDLITPVAESITAVKSSKERLESPKTLQKYCPQIKVCNSVKEALSEEGWNIICGSFYLMQEAIQIKTGQ